MADIVLAVDVDIAANQFSTETDDEDSIREESSDSEDNVHEMSLHYSKEDVHALAVKAEQMVLQSRCYRNYSNDARASWQDINAGESSDSDYESKISRECFISSEPNISQRRLSPNRKIINSIRKDWRKSLPECLEYFSPSSANQVPSQASTPASDLWEQEKYLSESLGSESQEQNYGRSVLNFGEDYKQVLDRSFDTDSSGSDICLVKTRREGVKNSFVQASQNRNELQRSKSAAEKLLQQIHCQRKETSLGSSKELEGLLKICKTNLNSLRERKNNENTFQDEFSQKYLENLAKKWTTLTGELEEMLHKSLEFENITKCIDTLKDELMNLSEVHHIKIEDSERGLEKCKSSLTHLSCLKEDLFNLNLSVHDLLCQVSIANHRPKISLLYHCKQEVISLYRSWEDVHKKVTEADGEYLKLSYVEAAHKSIRDVLTHSEVKGKRRKKNRKKRIKADDLILEDKLTKLQKMLEDLKVKIVTKDINTKATPSKTTPVVTATLKSSGRWKYQLPKLSFLSILIIIPVISVSCWFFPKCCENQASWQIWPQFGYSNGPPPI